MRDDINAVEAFQKCRGLTTVQWRDSKIYVAAWGRGHSLFSSCFLGMASVISTAEELQNQCFSDNIEYNGCCLVQCSRDGMIKVAR